MKHKAIRFWVVAQTDPWGRLRVETYMNARAANERVRELRTTYRIEPLNVQVYPLTQSLPPKPVKSTDPVKEDLLEALEIATDALEEAFVKAPDVTTEILQGRWDGVRAVIEQARAAIAKAKEGE